MTHDPIRSVLTTVQEAVSSLLHTLTDDDWAAATRCGDWTVADVARHLVVGERAFTIALGGTPYDLEAIDADARGLTPADLAGAYAEAAAGLRAAYDAAPPDQLVPSPLGQVAPTVVAEIRALEAVGHGWDLHGAGREVDLGSDAGLALLLPAADRLRVGLDAARPGNTAYGPASDPGPDAPILDRVVARLGRTP